MTLKPRGFPFLFYGREPEAQTTSELRYAVELASPISFATGQDVALDEAFRTAVQKETECTATLFFDPSASHRLAAVVVPATSLEPTAASKLVVRGLLAVHGITPIVECVHIASGGRGQSAWDERSREVREGPSADLLTFGATTGAGDETLASAKPAAVAPPEPSLVLRAVKEPPRASVAAALESPDAPLAFALEQGAKLSVSADGQRAVWYAAGLIAARRVGQPSQVLADLGSLPANLGRTWADAAIVDDTRVVAVAGRVAVLLVDGRPCSIVPLGIGVHRVATRGNLVFVGSASEASAAATLRTLRVEGRALVQLGEEAVDGELWGRTNDIYRLDPIAIDARTFCIASFSNKGKILKTEGRAEILPRADLERRLTSAEVGPTDPDLPAEVSVACELPDGGFVALIPTLVPVSAGSTLVPMQRRVVRLARDGSTRDYELPVGGYTSLALSPDGGRMLLVSAAGHSQQRLVVDVASGEVLSTRDAIGGCAAFLDDEHILVGSVVERWRDGTRVGTIAASPWQAAVDREQQTLIVLDLEGAIERFGIEQGGLVPLGRFAGIASRPARVRERGRRVEQLVHGQWSPLP